MKRHLANAVVASRLRFTWLRHRRHLAAAARDPMRFQNALLEKIVRQNRDTTFGRAHGFDAVRTYADFREKVPVSDFEALRPYIDAEISRGERALTLDAPLRYVRTSGTTAQPKDIPLVASHLAALKTAHRISVANQYRVCPEAFRGSLLVITSPSLEGELANGKPFGSASGVVADSTPSIVRDKFVVPPEVFGVTDSKLKYLLMLRLALVRTDITHTATANASTLLTLAKLYREHAAALIEDVRGGGFFLQHQVPPQILAAIAPRLTADPGRAAELSSLQRAGPTKLGDLWPTLRLVVVWTCASAGVAVAGLRSELPPGARVYELGYLSSEFRGTMTIGRRRGSGLPTFDAHFFEFVERDVWDNGGRDFLTLGELKKGREYYIIVTTPSGLYRYFINDIVRVAGHWHRMPLLQFMQKGKGATNITGEKLYESQVLAAVGGAMGGAGRTARFVMMLADEQERRYRLYVEPDAGPELDPKWLADAVDAQLQAMNIEYGGKRESGRLGELYASWLKAGTEEAFKEDSVRRGQREGQFKMVALTYRDKCLFDLEAQVVGRSG